MDDVTQTAPTVTLAQAKEIVTALAPTQSVLLLSPPGVGKSAAVEQAAAAAGLACKSLLGTQIAPEDVSGIPRIVGERSVFCPPRVLLPEDRDARPFCLFLDELPACSPDIQKAFYSLLLERRVGEYPLPKGTWVVAAGNRAEDRSLVRSLSAALVNRVTILNVAVSVKEWLEWAKANGVRREVLSFIVFSPASLQRPVPVAPAPFSTPRAWVQFSKALDCLAAAGRLTPDARRAVAFGMLSPEDAASFDAFVAYDLAGLRAWYEYVRDPSLMPASDSSDGMARRYAILGVVREAVASGVPPTDGVPLTSSEVCAFLSALRREDRVVLLLDQVEKWAGMGADAALLDTLNELTADLA